MFNNRSSRGSASNADDASKKTRSTRRDEEPRTKVRRQEVDTERQVVEDVRYKSPLLAVAVQLRS